mmetsp:Transcript_29978/g.73795  ORF Transcript_29978/g.73795 Transcript_29978/m.73795 type:complete len:819 (-) Transcript_29978:367-2823(-)|eukprot:CAMPEP_0206231076 /NCGR_PEP_ID=MMETSP0047_2-20121206/10632_1 /ASSEMBLY_ACC=CAM_ASM_000192 /TAXON_ID=195065 /ORGANISM="Chroomonas mesostigmatica_cf, Strain CCMP1168" /LENGTH=818 /DNA_ID=CAMNT_0053654607 /DNA_START=69 /DNA_END=2525 /DNA_ORIENTATION=-
MPAKGGAIKAKLNTAPGAGGYMAKQQESQAQAAANRKSNLQARVEAPPPVQKTGSLRRMGSNRNTSVESLESGALDGGDPNAGMVNMKRSLAEMERWPGIVNGYLELIAYTGFFLLYVFVLTMQLEVPIAYQIDTMVRNNLLDQDGALAAVQTQGDVFSYLLAEFGDDGNFDPTTEPLGGVLGKLFESTWYNDDPFVPDEQGYLFNYNRLIGGVQIIQQRGASGPCAGTSMYDDFYPTCYTSDLISANPPWKSNSSGWYQDFTDPEYLNKSEASKFGDRAVLEDPTKSYKDFILSSFQYDPSDDAQGYKVFLSLADGTDRNLEKIRQLRQLRWLDKGTRTLQIKYTFYNGNFRRFAFAKVSFTFDQGGQFLRYDPDSGATARIIMGGTTVEIASVKMEPYLVPEDFLLLGLEILFMIWTFMYITNFIRSFVVACVRRELKKHLSSWMVLDLANYMCFVIYFAFRITLIKHILDNVVEVPTSKYKLVFEQASQMTRQQLQVNFINILLCIFRFFKFYEFQPRLRIINTTLGASTVNLYHFLVIFFIIFTGFAVVAHLIFGGQYRDFYSLGNSMQVLFESLLGNYDLGPTIGNSNLSYLDPNMGVIFFISWIFTAGMVLLNVFVAILMDSYAAAKEEGAQMAKRAGMEQPTAVADDVGKFLGRIVRSFDTRSWKYSENSLRLALQHLESVVPDPEDKTYFYTQELEKLKAQQEALQERIEELELRVDDPNEEAYHPMWNDKSVTLSDIAAVLPKVSKRFRTERPDVHVMEGIWDDVLAYCPEDEEEFVADEDREMLKLKETLGRLIQENSALRAELGNEK